MQKLHKVITEGLALQEETPSPTDEPVVKETEEQKRQRIEEERAKREKEAKDKKA